jgi:hypothetical protein
MDPTGWSALAQEGIWGVLIGVILAGMGALATLAHNQRITLKAYAQDAERADERLEQMIKVIENQQHIMTEVVQSNTSALVEVRDAVSGMTRAVERMTDGVSGCAFNKEQR